MMFAVAGATSSRPMPDAREMCSMSEFAPRAYWSVITRRRVMASKVTSPTNAVADRVMIAATSWPRFCSSARHFHGLVGADAAGDAERDQGHGYSAGSTATFSTLPSFTSFWASRTSFSLPVVRGVQPRSSCRARAPARVTNSNAFGTSVR